MTEVGFEPTPRNWTATWTQRLGPLGHPVLWIRFKYEYIARLDEWILIYRCYDSYKESIVYDKDGTSYKLQYNNHDSEF